DPASCLPAGAVACDPAAGCTPRFVLVDHHAGAEHITGLLDLDTRAFAVVVDAGGTVRVLASGGTAVDPVLRDAFGALVDAASTAGIDLPALLAQPVTLRIDEGGSTRELTVSLLEGLQLTTRPTHPTPGGTTTAAAGLIVHIGAW